MKFNRTTLPGFDAESVRPQLASLTKSAEDVAGRLLSGQSSTVKRGVDQATGLRYVEALRRIGRPSTWGGRSAGGPSSG